MGEKKNTPVQQAFAIAIISIAIASMTFDLSVHGQITTIQPSLDDTLLEDEALVTFNATYWNGTQAVLDEVVLNFEESDQIVQFINAIIQSDEEVLEELEPIIEEEPEIEEEEESEDSDNDNDNGNDDSNDDSEPEELEEPMPDLGPPTEGDGGEGLNESEDELALELNPCGAIYLAMVGAGPPEYCIEKYQEAAEKARTD